MNSARTDLCGGCGVIRIPTATFFGVVDERIVGRESWTPTLGMDTELWTPTFSGHGREVCHKGSIPFHHSSPKTSEVGSWPGNLAVY